VGWGHCTPKTMNTAVFFLLLLALFILTSILNANFLAQTISEKQEGLLKLMVGALSLAYTIYWVT